jgi:hypothetical protein
MSNQPPHTPETHLEKDPLADLTALFPTELTPAQLAKAKTVFFKEMALRCHQFYGGKMMTVPKAGLYSFNWRIQTLEEYRAEARSDILEARRLTQHMMDSGFIPHPPQSIIDECLRLAVTAVC